MKKNSVCPGPANSLKGLMKNENRINELKGNLFEYLVGEYLARQFSLEAQFLQDIPNPYHLKLIDYEKGLRDSDPDLFSILPLLAEQTGQFIMSKLQLTQIERINLIGKITHPAQEEYLGEADLILKIKDSKSMIPLSLKLSKHRAYVNTKNAGIQSFLTKYFSYFHVEREQKGLGDYLQECFLKMGFELYQEAQISSLFPGYFDEKWKSNGFSELPGELPPDMREIVRDYYSLVIGKIYGLLRSYWEKNPFQFKQCLKPLCGLARPDIIQVICFHCELKDKFRPQRYVLKDIQLQDLSRLEANMDSLDFPPLKIGLSSFELRFKSSILQIRVKPMNKFTALTPKINCSVKFLE